MDIELTGIPVKKVYYKGQVPKISNGYFKISNASGSPTTAKLLEVFVADGEKEFPVNKYYLYKLPEYVELDPMNILVGEKEEIKLDVSFPVISEIGLNKNNITVNMKIKLKNEILQSSSPVIIEIRIPKN